MLSGTANIYGRTQVEERRGGRGRAKDELKARCGSSLRLQCTGPWQPEMSATTYAKRAESILADVVAAGLAEVARVARAGRHLHLHALLVVPGQLVALEAHGSQGGLSGCCSAHAAVAHKVQGRGPGSSPAHAAAATASLEHLHPATVRVHRRRQVGGTLQPHPRGNRPLRRVGHARRHGRHGATQGTSHAAARRHPRQHDTTTLPSPNVHSPNTARGAGGKQRPQQHFQPRRCSGDDEGQAGARGGQALSPAVRVCAGASATTTPHHRNSPPHPHTSSSPICVPILR